MALEGKVVAMDGTEIELKAYALCPRRYRCSAVEMVEKFDRD